MDQNKIQRFNELKNRASKNFDKYLNALLNGTDVYMLPKERLSDREWRELNGLLSEKNVKFIETIERGVPYMQFSKINNHDTFENAAAKIKMMRFNELKNRASKSFDKYLNALLNGTDVYMLPKERLSDREWRELNDLLSEKNVKFVEKMERGVPYMQFSKTNNHGEFKRATAKVKVMQFNAIRNKYPYLSDSVIQEIVDNQDNISPGEIYNMIRHTKKKYNLSQAEFNKAVAYGKIPTRYIDVSQYQQWTWVRQSRVHQPHAKRDIHHISLNVNIVEGLIKALDDVLAQDAGRYIEYYKFPKSDYYDEAITRHDPVTIYLSARNRDIEQKIVRAVAPYARSNEGLLGEILGYGVDISPETTQKYGMSVGEHASMQIYNALRNINARN